MKVVEFSDLKTGKLINSGYEASVYALKNFDSLVVKTNSFNPNELVWDVNPFTHTLLSSKNKKTTVMKRIEGKPLHGKEWSSMTTPFVTSYKMELYRLLKAPEKAFVDYINTVKNLRKNGYQIDTVNPNNILYDKKRQKFNIVDIQKKDKSSLNEICFDDFTAFWDDVRLLSIYDKANFISKFQVAKLVKKLIQKIETICLKQGCNIEITPPKGCSFISPAIHFYNNQQIIVDKILKSPKVRERYLIHSDDGFFH